MTRRYGRRRFHARGAGLLAMLSPFATACARATTRAREETVDMSEEHLWYAPYGVHEHAEHARRQAPRAFAKYGTEPAPVPSGSLEVDATAELPEDLAPSRVLAGARGTVVCGPDTCCILGPHGRVRRSRPRGGSEALNRGGGYLLATSVAEEQERGGLEVYAVPSGTLIGRVPLAVGHETPRQIRRLGSFYLVLSIDEPPANSGTEPSAGAQLLWLPGAGLPRSGRVEGFITSYRSGAIAGDVGPHGFVLATDRGVQWTDWALRPTTSRPLECRPHAFAVGPHGEAALVAGIGTELVLVSFDVDGRERFRVLLPPPTDQGTGVIVDSSGRTIVTLPGSILAYDGEGRSVWARGRDGRAPALALADGHVLFDHNRGLWLADPAGQVRRVWRAPTELATAPVVHGTRVYVATKDTLYTLR